MKITESSLFTVPEIFKIVIMGVIRRRLLFAWDFIFKIVKQLFFFFWFFFKRLRASIHKKECFHARNLRLPIISETSSNYSICFYVLCRCCLLKQINLLSMQVDLQIREDQCTSGTCNLYPSFPSDQIRSDQITQSTSQDKNNLRMIKPWEIFDL